MTDSQINQPQHRVTVYYSSVAGVLKVKKDQMRVMDLLAAHKVAYTLIDVAADEDAKMFMKGRSGKSVLPQIFVDGEYKGTCEEFDEANEFGEAMQWLGVDNNKS